MMNLILYPLLDGKSALFSLPLSLASALSWQCQLFSSVADRHALKTHHFISDHNDSPHEQRLSRCVLNNSISFDSAADESIQTPIQLIALYEKTIELAAKNKINVKNAFNIGLVERLPEILEIIAFDDKIDCLHHEPNFVKAGSVIDTRYSDENENFSSFFFHFSFGISVRKFTVIESMRFTLKLKN